MLKRSLFILLFLASCGKPDCPPPSPDTVPASAPLSSCIEVANQEAVFFYSSGKGIDVDLLEEIHRRTGLSFSCTVKPRARIWAEMKSGTLSMTANGIRTPERERFACFIPYIAQYNHALIRDMKYRTAEDFLNDPNAVLAVVRSYRHGAYFDAFIEKLRQRDRVLDVTDVDTLYRVLSHGQRADMILSLPVFYIPALQKYGLSDKVLIRRWDPSPKGIAHCLVLSKSLISDTQRQKIESAVREIRADGTLAKILSRYLPPDEVRNALSY